jgi:hypothetical protein
VEQLKSYTDIASQIGSLLLGLGTLIVGIAGLYLTHSIRRQLNLKIAEQRLTAYSALWVITLVATPSRLQEKEESGSSTAEGPLTVADRLLLHHKMTSWYYEHGNGMLLESRTRAMYLKVKQNLICPLEEFQPYYRDDTFHKQPYKTGELLHKLQEPSNAQLQELRKLLQSEKWSDKELKDLSKIAKEWSCEELKEIKTWRKQPGSLLWLTPKPQFETDEELKEVLMKEYVNQRGRLSIHQLSLLRTRMKADLAIYGPPFEPVRRLSDIEFLQCCNERIAERPWNVAS